MTRGARAAASVPRSVRILGGSPLIGTLAVPGDKSISHRALLFAALADGVSQITGLSDGADVEHTVAAIRALGAEVTSIGEHAVSVTGGTLRACGAVIDTGNSGTGIRLLAGLAATLRGLTILHGDASIAGRPMDRIATPLRLMGAQVDGREGGRLPPLEIRGGGLHGIDYSLPVASAQVKGAILIAALAADGPTVVREPTPSRAHTEEMLAARGADIVIKGTTIRLLPSKLSARDEVVPGDPSQAAFWLAGAASLPGSDVTIKGIYLGPARNGFLDVLQRMGADLAIQPTDDENGPKDVRVRGRELHATEIEPAEIAGVIDEIPALAVAAALADGVTRVRGAAELRVKESDRIATTAAMLTAFGAHVEEVADGLTITGGTLHGAQVNSHGDHRIAMAATIAAVAAHGVSIVDGFDAITTSYPTFLTDLEVCSAGALTRQ